MWLDDITRVWWWWSSILHKALLPMLPFTEKEIIANFFCAYEDSTGAMKLTAAMKSFNKKMRYLAWPLFPPQLAV